MDSSLYINLFTMYLYVLGGFILGKVLTDAREKVRSIGTKILVLLISPLQIFITLTTTTFQLSFSFIIQIILVALGSFLVMTLSSHLYFKRYPVEPKKKGAFFLLNAYPNVMFFTIPIVISLFPDELIIVSVIFASTMLILRGSVSTYLCEQFGSDRQMSAKESLLKLIKFPPIIAIILSSLVISLQIPLPNEFLLSIKSPISTIASASGSILIGMILASIIKTEVLSYKKDLSRVAMWRFVISSLYFLAIAYLLSFSTFQTEIRTILLIILTGPPAVYNVIFSVYFNLDEKFAAVSVATLTLVSLLFLPLIYFIGLVIF